MTNILKTLIAEEKGQGMAEYGLILALIAVVVIGALQLMGTTISDKFGEVNGGLTGTETGTD